MLTGLVRQYALSRNILDIPNQRSSHTLPVPRGGGMAFIIGFLIVVCILAYIELISYRETIAFLGSGLWIALLGFLDDHGHIPARWRLVGHFVAACFILYWLGGMPAIVLGTWKLSSGFCLSFVAVIYLVWLVNLYNFMDGINGLASMEAVFVCLGGALLYLLAGYPGQAILPMVLAAAVAGFLPWNFPSARIFMGDAGSGFLGLMLGILSIEAATVDALFFWCWLILCGVFIVDATLTLLRRMIQGDKLYQAHRSHAYQQAARRYHTHTAVTLGVLMLNALWLLPMAIVVAKGYISGFLGLSIAYFPLIILAARLGAGKRDLSDYYPKNDQIS
ncbi:MraY family glycosyltransferase [Legionella oakridgensis]|uniref:Alpha-N-acetylglucosaminyltransferase n=2 Tax=Legionella oakridgensis TaxID=29423 RepID=A0A0W0WZL1_9GAMM|nr:glycosyltransferase family 4 protein [Legionella oakridgensis]ETO93618.1 UDP-N-acetylmuramyl pentapeptide phosphotransferase/UDP-N-acetylglucosamine-1-phosphate transferase [Legionella oakridgensis RV-2-2007]KTD37756.1 alpha-N-acetylglucosaminyltransferase [Legionella oakridgensis]STY19792.1 alpha-N-acetylglucosaminyltransferase [Legionella longbeachae]